MMPAWLAAVQEHGARTAFWGATAENIILPLPSPPFPIGAGAMLIPQTLTWQAAFLPMVGRIAVPGAVGTTLATSVTFAVCYWGGKRLIDRCGRWLGFDWRKVTEFERRFAGRWEGVIFVARALPVFPMAPVSAAAGVMRLPWPPFVLWTFAGSLIRCLLLGYIGFLTRGAYETASRNVTSLQAALAALALAAIFVLALRLGRRARRR